MILNLLILYMAAVFLLWRRRRRAGLSVAAVATVFLFLVGQGWLPRLMLERLQTISQLKQPQWNERNVIVVLGFGIVRWPDSTYSTHTFGFSRVFEGARLYAGCKRAGRTCKILASGGDPKGNGVVEAEVIANELADAGIPRSDLLVEGKSNNTFENARLSAEILKAENFDYTVLVSSGAHLPRAMLYFKHFGVDPAGSASDRFEALMSPLPLAFNFAFADLAFHEYAGFGTYWFYQFMGWN